MFNQLENPGMLDQMLYDWYTFRNTSVWTPHLKLLYGKDYKEELWRRWLNL